MKNLVLTLTALILFFAVCHSRLCLYKNYIFWYFQLKMVEKKTSSSSGFTKEEELLLQDFSRNVSTKSSALFYGNAFVVSCSPICKCHVFTPEHQHILPKFHTIFPCFAQFSWNITTDYDIPLLTINRVSCISGLFWRIHQMELLPSLIFFVIITGISTYLMALAYKNTKFTLKHKVANKREDAVTREVSALLADKKMSRKEKDERYVTYGYSLFCCRRVIKIKFWFLEFCGRKTRWLTMKQQRFPFSTITRYFWRLLFVSASIYCAHSVRFSITSYPSQLLAESWH